jgi:uncharacterized protein YjeT (DUF2065 family)
MCIILLMILFKQLIRDIIEQPVVQWRTFRLAVLLSGITLTWLVAEYIEHSCVS